MTANRFRFRAWCDNGKAMVRFVLGQDNMPYIGDDGECYHLWLEHGDPIMQSTGLTDKNGKEIFEGDVVRQMGFCPSREDDGNERDKPHTWVVVADERNTGFHPFTSCYSDQGSVRCIEVDCCCYAFSDEMEVIGNIYENPELLEAI